MARQRDKRIRFRDQKFNPSEVIMQMQLPMALRAEPAMSGLLERRARRNNPVFGRNRAYRDRRGAKRTPPKRYCLGLLGGSDFTLHIRTQGRQSRRAAPLDTTRTQLQFRRTLDTTGIARTDASFIQSNF